MSPFDPASVSKEIEALGKKSEQPGFWDDRETAQKTMQEKKRLEDKMSEYDSLTENLEDLEVMISLAEEEGLAAGTPEGDQMADEITEAYEFVIR